MSLMPARVSTNNDVGHIFILRLNEQLISQAICVANFRPEIRMKITFLVLIFSAKAHRHDTRDHIPTFFVKLCGWTKIASIDGHFTTSMLILKCTSKVGWKSTPLLTPFIPLHDHICCINACSWNTMKFEIIISQHFLYSYNAGCLYKQAYQLKIYVMGTKIKIKIYVEARHLSIEFPTRMLSCEVNGTNRCLQSRNI